MALDLRAKQTACVHGASRHLAADGPVLRTVARLASLSHVPVLVTPGAIDPFAVEAFVPASAFALATAADGDRPDATTAAAPDVTVSAAAASSINTAAVSVGNGEGEAGMLSGGRRDGVAVSSWQRAASATIQRFARGWFIRKRIGDIKFGKI